MTPEPRIAIGEINVSGVKTGLAERVGPAIKRGLMLAASRGLGAVAARDISITLPHGASERQIVEAVIAAVSRGRGKR